ncbi:MAG TPA: LuxR C-terminal-related transcriptional regulator [Gemmatimonadaceae bacterium]|nr:LuxR C-terminal-related transcriptional regulator [Gemmatimonadaceae bacterium]
MTTPASATVARHHPSDEHADARLREAATRIAASLAHFAANHSRRSTISESPVLVEDVVTGEEAHRVRGEVLALAAASPVVLVTIERHPAGHPSYDQLRAAYGLTAVESRVAALLAERLSNREIAQLLGVTGHTARRHTERVLRKLGVNRRTAVRRELLRSLERSQAGAGSSGTPGEGTSTDTEPARRRGQGAGSAAAVEPHGAVAARWLVARPRVSRTRKRSARHGQPREKIIVLLSRERERQAVRDAMGDEVVVQFAAALEELHPPWVGLAPVAVLAELENGHERELEHVLRKLQRAAPAVPVWVHAPLDRASVRLAVRLATHGLIVDVITTVDDLQPRLRALLSDARAWSEGEALWGVWEPWVVPEAREIVSACVEASARDATTRHLARKMNTSARSLSRQMTQLKLPAAPRMMALCRLLRAMHRLDHRAASIKAIASELGYPSAPALRMQLTYVTGLRFSRLEPGSRFATLAGLVHAELSELRSRSTKPVRRGTRSGSRRPADTPARGDRAGGAKPHAKTPIRKTQRKPNRALGRHS